jgi:hypothetical protein
MSREIVGDILNSLCRCLASSRILSLAATPSRVPAVEATETFPKKALFPQLNRIGAAGDCSTGLRLTVAGSQIQTIFEHMALSHASAPSSAPAFSFRRRNHDTFKIPVFLRRTPITNQCNSALIHRPANNSDVATEVQSWIRRLAGDDIASTAVAFLIKSRSIATLCARNICISIQPFRQQLANQPRWRPYV